MADSMDWCVAVASPIVYKYSSRQTPSLGFFGKFAVCQLYSGEEGDLEDKIYGLLLAKFFGHVTDSLRQVKTRGDVIPCIKAAYARMDKDVEALAPPWQTENRVLLVIVCKEENYFAVCGRSSGFIVVDEKPPLVLMRCSLVKPLDETRDLKEDCTMLIIAGRSFAYYLRPETFPYLLNTRLEALGLPEACKSMVGRFPDIERSLIVLTFGRRWPSDGPKAFERYELDGAHGPDLFLEWENQHEEPSTSVDLREEGELPSPDEENVICFSSFDPAFIEAQIRRKLKADKPTADGAHDENSLEAVSDESRLGSLPQDKRSDGDASTEGG